MAGLRHKLVALFSAVVILLAMVVLPGCSKKDNTPTPKKPAQKKLDTGIE